MAEHKNMLGGGLEDEKMNRLFQNTASKYKGSADVGTEPIEDNPHDAPPSGQHPVGPMNGNLMGWTKMLEAMDIIIASITEAGENPDIGSMSADSTDTSGFSDNDNDIMEKLNKLFTPILVMQGFENNISSQVQEAVEQADVLTEKNIIQFDDATRMAQLISVCAILLQQKKNTENYQMYAKASAVRNQAKINMQKEEYDAAKALAQKYLVMVSTTNNSPVARDAATSLLPQTQH